MRGARLAALAAIIAVCLPGCGGSGNAPPPTAATQPVATAPKPRAAEAQPQSLVPPPTSFVYNPSGLRDPFQPFLKLEEPEKAKKKPDSSKALLARAPLQRFALEELRLVGILWSEPSKASALVEDPQGKGYAVGVGTLLGDRGGRIVKIQPDRVVVEEKSRDLFGEEKVTVMNMPLHRSEGEVGR